MPAAWTARDEKTYKKIKGSCVRRRACKKVSRSDKARAKCRDACSGISSKKLRDQCKRACRTEQKCVDVCESMSARIVNAQRSARKRKRRR